MRLALLTSVYGSAMVKTTTKFVGVYMSLYGASVEYGLHCLLYLVDPPDGVRPSSRDLAEFQGVSPAFIAKLLTQLEKVGIVTASEGVNGGFNLARSASSISVLDVVDALERGKPLFQCREIRNRCVLNDSSKVKISNRGVCAIHAVMLEGERRMREALAETSLADIADEVAGKQSDRLVAARRRWFEDRAHSRRTSSPHTPTKKGD
jgi:Rrf2 family protein